MTEAPARSGRVGHIPEIDALRGLAALVVVLHHWTLTFQVWDGPYAGVGRLLTWMRHSPFSALIAGYPPVILFFVLSGLVLGLPYVERRETTPGAFIIRRICRIYLPYLVALAVAVACALVFTGPRHPELGDWFNSEWHDITAADIRNHVLFLGAYNNRLIDPVLWSLVHELRVSLVFPWLAMVWRAQSWRTNLALAVAALGLGGAGQAVMATTHSVFDGFVTIDTIGSIAAGFLLAQYFTPIRAWYHQRTSTARAALAVLGVLTYAFAEDLPSWLWFFKSVPTTIVAVLITVAAVSRPRLSAWLRRPFPQFFGRISYSLYLYHAVVILSVMHAGVGRAPMALLVAGALLLTVAVSTASYRWVERPAIQLGRRLTTTSR